MTHSRKVGAVVVALVGLMIPACAFHEQGRSLMMGCSPGSDGCGDRSAVLTLASEIDHVEHHIDKHGTIVAQSPTIWGEARLTKHRHEFEKQMWEQFNTFDVTINGFVARSDQAYLAQAFALMAALGNKDATTGNKLVDVFGTSVTSSINSTNPAQNLVSPMTTTQITNADGSKTTTTQSPGIVPTAPFTGTSGITFKPTATNVALEPTVVLDQRARFLNHLHELRRRNEGDDTADSPGYSLTLVRVPISVVPGKCTRVGHGAEITISATPVLDDELLPTTVRNLVIHDLIDLLGVPVSYLAEHNVENKFRQITDMSTPIVVNKNVKLAPSFNRGALTILNKIKIGSADAQSLTDRDVSYQAFEKWKEQYRAATMDELPGTMPGKMSTTLQRRARVPLSPTQLVTVLGKDNLELIAKEVKVADGSEFNSHLILDVHKFLTAELEAAYDYVANHHFRTSWWDTELPHALAEAIRTNNLSNVNQIYGCFLKGTAQHHRVSVVTTSLAWAIVVESALLNERLIEDMQKQASAKGCACAAPHGVCLVRPHPCPEAKAAFNEYVKCRWPIRVFALDPVSQDENIADVFSRRRESQLAISLAFASGQMSANSFTRYVRRLESDMATIALQRSVVGFSHGNDTFGWRFTPRFQTPPIEGNATTIFRDLIAGGPTRDQETRKTQLEPGIRECMALVIAPSFVPNYTFDTRSRWFSLTNPKHNEMSMKESVKLSGAIKQMQMSEHTIRDSDCYLDGEVARLLKRVHQLKAQLPLQTMNQQFPIENTLGGFAMFTSGITDLAPQLTGYYGEPGVVLGRESVIYLIGDHFSINNTTVLAGNRVCNYQMLSRRCLQVTVPADVRTIPTEKDGKPAKAVDIHVATPYGVSGHIQVEVAGEAAPLATNPYRWQGPTAFTAYFTNDGKTAQLVTELLPPRMAIDVPKSWNASGLNLTGTVGSVKLDLALSDNGNTVPLATSTFDLLYDGPNNRVVTNASLSVVKDAISAYLDKLAKDGKLPVGQGRSVTMTARLVLPAVLAPVEPEISINLVFKK